MNNIVSYAREVVSTFEELPFSNVDSLILSWLAYFRYPKITKVSTFNGTKLKDLYCVEYFDEMFSDTYDPESSRELFTYLACSPRFRNIVLKAYTCKSDKSKQEQFSAITFKINDHFHYVAYRGTDSTIVGWKEDFNMAFRYPIRAQEDAYDYLKKIALRTNGDLMVGGHSKGGNLAVYALANSDDFIKRRIVKAYSHDGPGFLEEVLKSDSFQSISNKIDKTVPKSSMIGMFLQQHENYRVVSSNSFSVWQHNPFSWTIKGNEFEYIDDLTNDAKYFNHTLNEWVASLTNEERERLVDILFSLIDDDVDKTDEIFKNWQITIPNALKVISNTDEQTKNFVKDIVKEFFSLCVKNFPELFKK